MRAVVAVGPGPDQVVLQERMSPVCGADDAIVSVEAVGICGSDVHVLHGNVSWDMAYPVTLGHEFSGRVVTVGERVTKFHVGDRIVSETAAYIDGASVWARTGRYNLDPNRLGFGARADGGMAELVRVPERCLHKLPDDVGFLLGALAEPLSVAYQATYVQTTIRPGDTVVVLGAGPIGHLCAWLACLGGAASVIVSGLPKDEPRREGLVRLGIAALATSATEARALLVSRSGMGADVVIDAAGASSALKTALDLVRPNGHITKVGWGPESMDFSLDPLVAKQVTLRGSFSHTWPVWERVLQILSASGAPLENLIGWCGSLSEWRDGFDAQASGGVVKAVLLPRST